MKPLTLLLFIASFLLSSCTSNPYGETGGTVYVDLDSLIRSQVAVLSSGNYSLEKSGTINQEGETQSLSTDSAYWANELDIFQAVDINKPSSLNAYTYDILPEKATYELKPDQKQNGVIKQIFDYAQNGKLRSFSAVFLEDNYLYTNQRNYAMHFDDQGILKSYSLEGSQKVLFVSEVKYAIEGKVQKSEDNN